MDEDVGVAEPALDVGLQRVGGGVRLFDALPDGIRLEKLSVSDGPFATHLRYRVIKS